MKTVLITVAEGGVVRNIIRSDFWSALMAHADIRVVLVMLPELANAYRKELEGERVVVVECPPSRPGGFEKVLVFLARNGFRSGTHSIMRHRAKAVKEGNVPVWVKETVSLILGNFAFLRSAIRAADLGIASSADVVKLFDAYKPSLVFATMITRAVPDVAVVREAKRRGIRTLGAVRGWDNLTTYGFLRVLPDRLFVQNDFLKEQALSRHDMPPSAVRVVGTAPFDAYTQEELFISRVEFCAKMGIDPGKKIILYAAIGDFIFPHEGELADIFEKLIQEGKLENTVVIFRAHPAFESPLQRMKSLVHVIPDRSAEYRAAGKEHWDMHTVHTAHLINSIRHAEVVVTAGSTMMIEAALMGKPIVSVAFDALSKPKYWHSIARFHDKANHIVALLKTGGVKVVYSAKELGDAIAMYLKNPEFDKEKRKMLVERFAGPNRGSAAKILGDCVAKELE